jgi:hypothetical protein
LLLKLPGEFFQGGDHGSHFKEKYFQSNYKALEKIGERYPGV